MTRGSDVNLVKRVGQLDAQIDETVLILIESVHDSEKSRVVRPLLFCPGNEGAAGCDIVSLRVPLGGPPHFILKEGGERKEQDGQNERTNKNDHRQSRNQLLTRAFG